MNAVASPSLSSDSGAPEVPDVIDSLVGIAPGQHLDRIRRGREQARTHAQQSYLSLFAPTPPVASDFDIADRFALAAFVAGLHGHAGVARFYAEQLAGQGARAGAAGVGDAIAAEVQRGAAQGPYGSYPAGPLSAEDKAGPSYAVSDAHRELLGERLSAALAHAHLLVFHPRDASPAALQALLDAGWTSTGIVTLSQLVAFLAFQIRVVTGLQALAQRPATSID